MLLQEQSESRPLLISHALADPSKAAEALIQAALGGDGKDNISVIVVLMLEAQDQILVSGVQLFAKTDRVHISQV